MDIHEKFFSKIGLNYLIFGLAALFIQIIILNITRIVNGDLLNDFNVLVLLTSICNYLLPFPILYYLMKKIESEKLEKQSLTLKTFLLYFAISLTLMWIGNLIGTSITSAIGTWTGSDISNPVEHLINSSDIWLNLLLVSIIGPIFEEIIFRKLLIDRTIRYGARVSIILSAVIFGFFHGNLSQFFYAFFLGGFFAYIYIKTGKITYTIILHILINFMGSVVSLFVVESVQAITSNAYAPFDLIFVILYAIFLVSALLLGLFGLLRIKKAKFNGSKTLIPLKNPFKTSLLNPGMICFILFFAFEIIYSLMH